MTKIVQILLSPRVGGAETLAASLEAEWAALGIISEIVYLDQGERSGRLRRLRHLRRLLRQTSAEIIVAHSYLPALYARLALGRRLPVHSVLHSASDDFAGPVSRFIERTLAKRTASVIAVSPAQEKLYASRFPSVRLTKIGNGVSGDILPRSKPSSKPRRIVTLARVASQKRPQFWRAVADELSKTHPEVSFEWWGPLSGDAALDGYVKSAPPPASYMGATRDVASTLENADILFHPSSREAHSIVLLEAAVSGMPVVYADTIEAHSDDPAWQFQYSAESVSSAVIVLTGILDDWDAQARFASAYSASAHRIFGMRLTAKAYLDWICD